MYIIWAVAIILFGVLEGVTAQLMSIWFVIGAIGALIAAFCSANVAIQVVVFVAVSVVALLVTRPLVKKFIKPKMQRTNADRYIGEKAVVIENIDNMQSKGQVKVGTSIWSAKTDDGTTADCGDTVTVLRIEGVKLVVKKEN